MKKPLVSPLPPQMYTTYIERREADLKRLKDALAKGSCEEFSALGHQLKGNAPSFGFDELAVLGEKFSALSPSSVTTIGPQLVAEYERLIIAARASLPSQAFNI